ncbi:MAG: pyridoxal-phosphate dependent enzyme [Bacteroidales bacterium]
MATLPTYACIEKAHERIKTFVHRTPVLTCQTLNELTGAELYFKCENFQKVGAFKFRGATNAVLQLSEEDARKGVTTHSSGNHAQALSLAAKQRGIPAYIVMPQTAPRVKVEAVKGYGAEVTFCEPTLQAREEMLREVQERTGATFIHPYNTNPVICGQGTAAKELIEQQQHLDVVMAPVGGGGLLSGTALVAKKLLPDALVWAAEPKGADDAYRSFHEKALIPSLQPETIADGLLTSLGSITFQIIREQVDDILLAKEPTIVKAMQLLWERMKIIVEPSGAVPLASILDSPYRFKGKKVGIIISGGNVDLTKLPF